MFVEAMPDRVEAGGVTFETMTRGAGKPLLFLHAGHGMDANDPLVERLAAKYKVTAASHPGWGLTPRPADVTTVDDLAYSYLDLIEKLNLQDITLDGASLGGWLACELATKGTGRISNLVLLDAVGIKVSDRETRDIVDIFAHTNDQMPGLLFSDPEAGKRAFANFDFVNMPEEVAVRFARNREALVQFGWSPTLYNPKLKQRLHRIRVPTLVLWGADDRFTASSYGRAYAAAIPGAKFETIANAGHYGYYEQPDEYAKQILAFLNPARAR